MPQVAVEVLAKNPIATAVCECRFATVLEFDRPNLVAFQGALRRQYPTYSKNHALNIGPGSSQPDDEPWYQLKSIQGDWTIALKNSAISLETRSYTSYREFSDRLARIIDLASPLVDSDFFTRVGLRYVNRIPIDGPIEDWIRPELVAPLIPGDLGTVDKFRAQVRGSVDESIDWTLQHGFREGKADPPEYEVDIDVYSGEVPSAKLRPLVDVLNHNAYQLFRWCVGPRTISWLRGDRD